MQEKKILTDRQRHFLVLLEPAWDRGLDSLASNLSCSLITVRREIKTMIEAGLVERQHRTGERGSFIFGLTTAGKRARTKHINGLKNERLVSGWLPQETVETTPTAMPNRSQKVPLTRANEFRQLGAFTTTTTSIDTQEEHKGMGPWPSTDVRAEKAMATSPPSFRTERLGDAWIARWDKGQNVLETCLSHPPHPDFDERVEFTALIEELTEKGSIAAQSIHQSISLGNYDRDRVLGLIGSLWDKSLDGENQILLRCSGCWDHLPFNPMVHGRQCWHNCRGWWRMDSHSVSAFRPVDEEDPRLKFEREAIAEHEAQYAPVITGDEQYE